MGNSKVVATAVMSVLGIASAGLANATDGYFSHGYGMKAKGRGGASTAMTTDTFGGANNPATMVWVGNRIDAGVDLFMPDRDARRSGSLAGVDGVASGNDRDKFFIPEFGYNKLIDPNLSLGVTVYGNGGMNTDYNGAAVASCAGVGGGAPANLLCGSGHLGVNLSQLVIAPVASVKLNQHHSIGVSPQIIYQRFEAYGLQPFGQISSDANNLTNNGADHSKGFSLKLGWLGKVSESLSIGASYTTKAKMDEFNKYRGLFADHGKFDIPENYNFGVAIQASPKLTIAADFQRINYGKVSSVGNPSNQTPCPGAACLGATGSSIGFGWDNVNVIKLGVEYAYSNSLQLRAGYNKSDNPIQARDVTFNILAPGVVRDHVTAGFTYKLSGGDEITMAYMHAFRNSVSGPANNPYFRVGGTETIGMSQNSIGIAWGRAFH
jgi:long-chain fatty acid transport protein